MRLSKLFVGSQMDKIIVKDLVVQNIIGVDSWERVKRQPVIINMIIQKNISEAGKTDKLTDTINYGTVSKVVTEFAEKSSYKSVEALADGIAKVCINKCFAPKVTVSVEKPRALLHADSAGVEITRTQEDYAHIESTPDVLPVSAESHEDIIFVKDLKLNAIIGVNPWEREEKQIVILNFTIYPKFRVGTLQKDHVINPHNYRTIVRTISKHVEESSYKTVEAFSTAIARIAITQCNVKKITVRVEKPSALIFAKSAGIEITRTDGHFPDETLTISQPRLNSLKGRNLGDETIKNLNTKTMKLKNDYSHFSHFAFIGLGSNLGNLVENINEALELLEKSFGCKILDTSFLYESSPMYYSDQSNFLNAACKIATNSSPEELLIKLKNIESDMGRVKTMEYGPRPIDLDILFYDDIEYSSDTLTIPHPKISEREFVLRPLCDIAKGFEHPKLYRTCGQLFSQYLKSPNYNSENFVKKILPIHNSKWDWNSKTFIMGVLNITPDSFSDGGLYYNTESAVEHAKKLISEGADIIDIGGMSTRPNADDVPIEVELARVIPVIKAIRAKGITNVPISIDTFRAVVAEKAIEAGANFINDISGGQLDSNMYQVMAKTNVPVCLQHMRGNPKTMTKLNQYDDVITDICEELFERVQRSIEAGVRRWNITIDPGIGFAKNFDQNFQILNRLQELNGNDSPFEGFPCLVGPSLKAFIGKAINQPDAQKRVWGTAAACSAAIAGGTDILRVHNVKEMLDVAKVSDKIYRISKN
ncbi:1150_t:CDS:2 [Diversispora eburnea]|uniref:Folic acid synthesis protein FOL1 n=1 Tax=Diversispora eburnea TaxID=1213867 RepID=A0A9N9B921_9GLOM|nr:1150_t:CDS:2 [Diversispora eburnea]